jgi:hypothetical protein
MRRIYIELMSASTARSAPGYEAQSIEYGLDILTDDRQGRVSVRVSLELLVSMVAIRMRYISIQSTLTLFFSAPYIHSFGRSFVPLPSIEITVLGGRVTDIRCSQVGRCTHLEGGRGRGIE